MGADDVIVSVPVGALMADAATLMASDGLLVLFAGVPNGTMAPLNISDVYLHNAQFTGTSGSTINDQETVIRKTVASELSPNRSVAAIGGMEAAREGIRAMIEGRYPGKIVILPQISGLPLTGLPELKETQPEVAAAAWPRRCLDACGRARPDRAALAAMIYTLTLNPALDRELTVPALALDTVLRASESRVDCGGKGFNVSRMLASLGAQSVALGFAGGHTGAMLRDGLAALGIATDFVWITGETRTNVSIIVGDEGHHIKVNEAGPTVSADELAALAQRVRELARAGDWWVLAGSLPPGCPPTASTPT